MKASEFNDAISELKENALSLCSDYYILYYLYKIKGVKEVEYDFHHLTNSLDFIFQRYTIYAIARESRHATEKIVSHLDYYSLHPIAMSIAESICDYEHHHDELPSIEEIAEIVLSETNNGENLLDWLNEAYTLFKEYRWAPEFGGEPWAKITNYLIKRLQGGNVHIFIDSCWHAQHNFTSYLNKILYHSELSQLQEILNAKQVGAYNFLAHYSTLDDKYLNMLR